jgi:hypothetical protein
MHYIMPNQAKKFYKYDKILFKIYLKILKIKKQFELIFHEKLIIIFILDT